MLASLAPFLDAPLTDLTDIDEAALECWEQQWLSAIPRGEPWSGWDWRDESRGWRRHLDRFEVAIWSGEQLCGLAIGKPSERRQNLSIYVAQGSPVRDHPLKGQIMPIVLDVAGAYGTALSCRELRLVNPLAGPLRRYEALGFALENPKGAPPYCVRPL